MRKENVEDIYKLSHMQQGMLFHGLYASEADIYFRQLSCSLRGELNLAAFEDAWRRVIARHAVLRTSFHWANLESPVQVVHRRVELPLDYRDWRGLGPDEQAARWEDVLRAEEAAKFDFTKAPLIRLTLIRLADDEHRLVFSNHHLLFDGWSRALLLKEVFTLYEGLCRGVTPQLERPRPYRDYISWLRRQDLTKAEGFWRQYLKGFTTPTPFAVDRAASDSPDAEGGRDEQSVTLSKDATAALQSFAARHQLTLNTIIQGAWALLLSRYSGKTDVVFGSVVSGRPAELDGVGSIVGLFINTLPVRVSVPRGAALLPWLKGLQEQQAELREFEYSPLVRVQGWCEVPRGTPLFESLLVVDNYPADASMRERVGGFEVGDIRGVEKNNYPVALSVIPNEELLLRMPFDLGRFEPSAVARMLGHLRTLLEGMTADPRRRLCDVPMLTADERELLRDVWSGRAESVRGASRLLHEAFEAQAAATPEAVAVSLGGGRLTYDELNRKANQLARHLATLGVGPEAAVGVFLERSIDSVTALLGILKAGGVYLPLDPAYPSERVEYVLMDAEPKVVLTQDDLLTSLPVFAAASDIFCLDSDWEGIAHESDENPQSGVAADNVAYVIYTSGSTGNPKGVCLPHGAASSHCEAARREFGVRAGDRVLQFSSLNFDVSLEQILTTLSAGGELVMRGPEIWSTAEFRERLRDESLTVVNPPTAYWHKLAQDLSSGEVAAESLRLAVAGGEAMSPQAVRLWQRSPLGGVRLVNAYGPTEAVITSLTFDVPAGFGEDESAKRVPIGRPLPSRAVYLLDEEGNNAPVGVPGELYIGGECLARGYLGRPELTAEKFVPDPFSNAPGARLYKTGDLGRYLAGGDIEFLGRADDQVKVRGFRIELGEVEAALASHESVMASAVAVRQDAQGEPRLVAYTVAREGRAVEGGELRAFLGRRLPEYMVPSAFVALEELPLTPNGKVDRHALPEPEAGGRTTAAEVSQLLTPTQELLIDIWAEILGVQAIGVHDNFFDLGGHSLLSTQLVSRLREVFHVELPLRVIFEKPTVQALAAEVETAAQAGYGVQAPPIVPAERVGPVPLSLAQQRLWFAEQLEPGTAAYNRPLAVRLSGRLDADALGQSLAEIVRRHEVLRTAFADSEDGPVQVVSQDFVPELPVTDLCHIFLDSEREARAAQIVAEEAVIPFDLSTGPPLRARLLRTGEEEHTLLLVMHHIVTDGWSEGVLVRELTALYAAHCEGRPSPLAELPIQYADYASWQRAWMKGEVLERQLDYWRRQLEGLPELRLDTDRPRPEAQTRRGAKRSLEVPAAVAVALKELGRRQGATLFMTLLAAYKTLLYRYTGQDDIAVGTGIANRNRAEAERLIGFFVNQLVLRTNLASAHTFVELLSKVREVTLAAYAHQDLPFERLVEELQPERDPGRQPFYQTVFLLQNAHSLNLDLPGLSCRPLQVSKGTSHFDLTWSASDTAQGLRVTVEYNTDIFDDATVERMLEDFASVLEGVASEPDAQLLDLALEGRTEEYAAAGSGDYESLREAEFAF